MKKTLLSAIIATILMQSCATIITGSRTNIAFNSDPKGASVVAVGKYGETTLCMTPCMASVHKKTKDIKFKMDNYYDETYSLRANADFQYWFLGNILLGGLVGMAVDMISGAYINPPMSVNVQLKKK